MAEDIEYETFTKPPELEILYNYPKIIFPVAFIILFLKEFFVGIGSTTN
jgi:hypothetical protein